MSKEIRIPLFKKLSQDVAVRMVTAWVWKKTGADENGEADYSKFPNSQNPQELDQAGVHAIGGPGDYKVFYHDAQDQHVVTRTFTIPETMDEQKKRIAAEQSKPAGPPMQQMQALDNGVIAVNGLSPEMQLMFGIMQQSSNQARTDAQRFVDGYTGAIERVVGQRNAAPVAPSNNLEVELLKKDNDRLRETFAEEKMDLRKKLVAELDLLQQTLEGRIKLLKEEVDGLRKRLIEEEDRHRKAEAEEASRHFNAEKAYLDEKLKLTRASNDAQAKADKKELDADWKKVLLAAVADPSSRAQFFDMAKGILSHDPALYQLAMQQTLAENAAAQATAGAAVAAG